MLDIDIEKMIPHRNSMKLVDEVLEINERSCVAAATVSPRWPLYEDGYVSPIILIELAAQTAGVNFGWREMQKEKRSDQLGWLVGIKNAEFYRDRIPRDTRIVISIEDRSKNDAYVVITGTARVGSELIGEMELQVFRPEPA
jgi:predicted hotdog family 3-hydroxylacyl-ACP dehydratase